MSRENTANIIMDNRGMADSPQPTQSLRGLANNVLAGSMEINKVVWSLYQALLGTERPNVERTGSNPPACLAETLDRADIQLHASYEMLADLLRASLEK